MSMESQTDVPQGSRGFGTQTLFQSINEPGTYICNWSGHLLRVPEDGIKIGRSPLISMTANEHLYVTKISDNPFIEVSKARLLAAEYDLPVKF
jgi:hypothetical protein